MERPFSIRIFVEQGLADGPRSVTKSNWDGQCVICPRSTYASSKSRPEFAQPGVYILLGDSKNEALPTIYIGEGDPVRNRLDGHFANKDFWSTAFVFTSSAGRLNKAHIQFLESKLVECALTAKRAKLDNGNNPQPPTLTPADRADAQLFLDEMLLVLPTLGVSSFMIPVARSRDSIRLECEIKGLKAEGFVTSGGFTVARGSRAVAAMRPSSAPSISSLRDELIANGVVRNDGTSLTFVQDFEFSSPSAAASVIQGGNTNGRLAWRATDGRTLKEIEEASIRVSVSEGND